MSDSLLRRVSTALSVVGIGVAGYLTYVHYAGLHPVCGISHGCETVQTSSHAYLAGIPVALLGLVTYGSITVALQAPSATGFLGSYSLTVIGFGFSLYLTYREVFTIHAICTRCVSSAVVFTLLAAVGTIRAARLDWSSPATADRVIRNL